MLTIATLVASVAAIGLGGLAWAQRRDARRRSAAWVAALAAVVDDAARSPDHQANALDGFVVEEREPGGHGGGPSVSTPAAGRGWVPVAAGGALVLCALAVLLSLMPTGRAPAPPRRTAPQVIDLLEMHHASSGDHLRITGTVRMGRHGAPVTAVVTAFDAGGDLVASGRAPLDDASLDADSHSSFQIEVPAHAGVRRYRVRFEGPSGTLTHVDRRNGGPTAH